LDTTYKTILWQQFGAAIDMLENAVRACPDKVWNGHAPQADKEFWYLAYHTLFFLDYYLSESETGFVPPLPFTLSELDPKGVLPERVYTKEELLTYFDHGRQKCQKMIAGLTEEKMYQRAGFERRDMTVAELLLYNMRHVQHHAAQLNLMLRQTTDSAPRWVANAKTQLG
jgi:hypothetical protein